MLENIQKDLGGIGKIYVYPDRKEARLAICFILKKKGGSKVTN